MTANAWAAFGSTYRVRFDEAGPDGLLRTSGLLRYAQDIAWQHSVARGFDRAWYRQRGLTWVVRAVDLEVLAPIALGASLETTTEVVGQRRVWARRLGAFRTGDRLLATVQTDWLLLDDAGRPARLPAEFEGAFAQLPAASGLGRVELGEPPSGAHRSTIAVRPHELDPMGHVNNAVYLDWFEEGLLVADPGQASGRALPRRVRLEYTGAAEPGADLVAVTWRQGDGWSHRVETATGIVLVRATLGAGRPAVS
jgi:acyl-CoA thioesterase FadM